MKQLVDHANRSDEPIAFAFLDVDALKATNDTLGHATGDLLLHELGEALRHGLRSYDIVVRYGGDEFVCALPGSRVSDAEPRLADVSALLLGAFPGATFSVGLASWHPGDGLDDVIARADADLYARRRLRRTPEVNIPSAGNS
jgi:diguanylate cyclase (GGDEF)-like protein